MENPKRLRPEHLHCSRTCTAERRFFHIRITIAQPSRRPLQSNADQPLHAYRSAHWRLVPRQHNSIHSIFDSRPTVTWPEWRYQCVSGSQLHRLCRPWFQLSPGSHIAAKHRPGDLSFRSGIGPVRKIVFPLYHSKVQQHEYQWFRYPSIRDWCLQ